MFKQVLVHYVAVQYIWVERSGVVLRKLLAATQQWNTIPNS